MENRSNFIKGFTIVVIIACISYVLGKIFPLVGSGGFGIITGMIISSFLGVRKEFQKGVEFSSKFILHLSIVLLGASINLKNIMHTGIESFPVIIAGITASFLVSNVLGKFLGIDYKMRNLIGAGTGICGGSAIAAVSSVIEPKEEDISYSLSIIFLFNVIAVFLFPSIGHLFNMTQHFFGIFAGSAINDTSSVVAAGYIFGDEAGKFATTVKLTRTMAIIPVVLIFSTLSSKKEKRNLKKAVPWFIIGFILMSLLRTVIDFFPDFFLIKNCINGLSEIGKFLIVMAISAIGLQTNLRNLNSLIMKPIILGLFTWLSVILSTLGTQILFNVK